jgi:hypothetical protein
VYQASTAAGSGGAAANVFEKATLPRSGDSDIVTATEFQREHVQPLYHKQQKHSKTRSRHIRGSKFDEAKFNPSDCCG